jgi:DNA (cytosine-5)-methyltransferase 1
VERNFRVASLFAGCGGMDLGISGGFTFGGRSYKRLPTEIVHASDFDKRVVSIYNLNFGHKAHVQDITELESRFLPSVDIVLGGFPCQSFSVVAQNPKRLGYKDAKGKLFFEMKRILEEKRPKAFVAENVKGLLSANKGEAFPLILQEFRDAGYYIKHQVLNASHFGVPQKRERIFIIGFRSKKTYDSFEFPNPSTRSNPISIRNFLLPKDKVEEKYFFSARAVNGMRTTRNSRTMNKGRVQDLDSPSNTLGAHLAKVSLNSTDPVLKIGNRYRMFTPREVARLQSFPDEFALAEIRGHNYIALGNAVPPVLMWHVSRKLIQALEGKH